MRRIFLLICLVVFFVSCGDSESDTNSGQDLSDSASAKGGLGGAETDLKGCKAVSYYGDSESSFALTNKTWCGDIKDRFKKKPDAPPMDFVYDELLKGYWSPSSASEMKWSYAQSYCLNFGSGWEMPDAYKLLSLFSQIEDDKVGFIHPIFADTDKNWFWSSSSESSSEAWYVDFNLGVLDYKDAERDHHIRCFRPSEF